MRPRVLAYLLTELVTPEAPQPLDKAGATMSGTTRARNQVTFPVSGVRKCENKGGINQCQSEPFYLSF
jgi:hypothetical protein